MRSCRGLSPDVRPVATDAGVATSPTPPTSPPVPPASTRERFVEIVAAAGGTRIVAERLGCTRSMVDMIRHGHRRPGLALAARIEDELGLPMRAWIERRRRP